MARNAWHTVIYSLRWHCHTTTCQIARLSPEAVSPLLLFVPQPIILESGKSSFSLSHPATYPRRFFFSNSPTHWHSLFNILRKTSEPTPSWNSQAWQIEKERGSLVIRVAHAKNTKKLTKQFLYSLWPPCLHSSPCPAVVQILRANIPHLPQL